jgi:hypothetical protein
LLPWAGLPMTCPPFPAATTQPTAASRTSWAPQVCPAKPSGRATSERLLGSVSDSPSAVPRRPHKERRRSAVHVVQLTHRGTFLLGKQAVHPPPSERNAQQAISSLALLKDKDDLVGARRGLAGDRQPTRQAPSSRACSLERPKRREKQQQKQQNKTSKQATLPSPTSGCNVNSPIITLS